MPYTHYNPGTLIRDKRMSEAETESEQAISLPVPVSRAADRVAKRRRTPNRAYVRSEIAPTGSQTYVLRDEGYKLCEVMSAEGNDLATIARALGIDRHTFAELRKRDPRAQEAVEYGRALLSDEITDLLLSQARNGVVASTIFLARSRAGFVNEGGTIEGMPQPKIVNNTQINISLVEPLTPEQFRQITQGAQSLAADNLPASGADVPPDGQHREPGRTR